MKTFLITGAALTLGTLALTTAPAWAASAPAGSDSGSGSGGVVSVTSAKDASAPIYGGSDVNLSGTCPDDAVTLDGISSPFFAGGQATIGQNDPQAFTGTATVLPDIPAGAHDVTVDCTNQSGQSESFTGSFTVTPTSTPVTPVTPAHPTTPVTPVTPAHPTTPVVPVTPAHSTTPVTPVTPAHPTTPVVPVTPAHSTTPVAPVTPVHPTTPVTPVTPTHPAGGHPSTSGTSGTIPSGAPNTGAASHSGNDAIWPIALAGAGVLTGGTMVGIWWGRRRQATGK